MAKGGGTKLQLIGAEAPVDLHGDIYAKDRARIAAIRWDHVHIRGDRSEAIYLPDRPCRSALSRGGFSFETTREGHALKRL